MVYWFLESLPRGLTAPRRRSLFIALCWTGFEQCQEWNPQPSWKIASARDGAVTTMMTIWTAPNSRGGLNRRWDEETMLVPIISACSEFHSVKVATFPR